MKIGQRIATPRGSGVIRQIEHIYDKPRYCVALDAPEPVGWEVGKLCCYFAFQLDNPDEREIMDLRRAAWEREQRAVT